MNFAEAYTNARAYTQAFSVYERAIRLAELNDLRDKQADALRKYLRAAELLYDNHQARKANHDHWLSICNRLRKITDADRGPWRMPECGGGPLP